LAKKYQQPNIWEPNAFFFSFRNTVPPSLCVSNMLYINSFKPVIIPIFRAKNKIEIISVKNFCLKLLNEIPFF